MGTNKGEFTMKAPSDGLYIRDVPDWRFDDRSFREEQQRKIDAAYWVDNPKSPYFRIDPPNEPGELCVFTPAMDEYYRIGVTHSEARQIIGVLQQLLESEPSSENE